MKINAKFIFKIAAIVGVPVTAYFAAKGSKSYQKGMEELAAQKPEEDITLADKALVAAKSYALAAGTGTLAVGSVIAMDRISMKELMAAGGLIAANKQLIKKKANELESYKDAVLHKLGAEKAEEIEKTAEGIATEKAYIDDMATDETVHMFHIDWLGFDLYFEAPFATVLTALADINQQLFDCGTGTGQYTMDRFFSKIGRTDLICEEIEHRGWDAGNLVQLEHCYWLPFEFKEILIGEGEDAERCIDIWTSEKPNETIIE